MVQSSEKLTKTEQDILERVTVRNQSISYIAKDRGCTERAIYKHLFSLKSKGYIPDYKFFHSKIPMHDIMPLGIRYYRLHNLHFIVTPYYLYPRYSREIGKSFFLGKWHITVNTENMEIQTRKKMSFDSREIDETIRMARESIEVLLPKIENRIGCEIVKDNKLNIRLVNHHLAEVQNGIARLVEDKKLEITDEFGNVWALVDKSKKVPEFETVDALKAIDDGRKLERHFNAMRDKDSMTVTELNEILAKMAKQNQFITESLNVLSKNIIAHDSFIQASAKVLGVVFKKQKERKQSQTDLKRWS